MRWCFYMLTVTVIGLVASCATVNMAPKQSQSDYFKPMMRHLDLGGAIFGYVDVDGDLQRMTDFLQQIIEKVSITKDKKVPVNLKKIIPLLGFDNIKAMGLSSYARGNVFRNKAFIILQGPPEGLMKLTGGPAHAIQVTNLAPADADIVFERDLNLKAIYDVLVTVLKQVAPEEANKLRKETKDKIPQTDVSYLQLIQKLDTHIMGFIRINDKKELAIPNVPIKIPHIELVVGIDNLQILFDAFIPKLKSIPVVKIDDNDAWTLITSAAPMPGDLGTYQPVLAKDKKHNRIYLATNKAFLPGMKTDKSSLINSDSFKKASLDLPKEGNGFGYMSGSVTNKVTRFMEKLSKIEPDLNIAVEVLKMVFPDEGVPVAGVTANLPEGILVDANTTMSHKTTLLALTLANPAMLGIMAAIAVPAFNKYKEQVKQEATK